MTSLNRKMFIFSWSTCLPEYVVILIAEIERWVSFENKSLGIFEPSQLSLSFEQTEVANKLIYLKEARVSIDCTKRVTCISRSWYNKCAKWRLLSVLFADWSEKQHVYSHWFKNTCCFFNPTKRFHRYFKFRLILMHFAWLQACH